MNVVPRRRSAKRARAYSGPRMLTRSIPRAVRYNGEAAFSRTCNFSINIAAGSGFSIGASSFSALAFTFDPTGLTYYGSGVSFVNVPLTNAAEIAAFWDLVAIDKVEMTMTSIYDPSTAGANTYVPRLVVCNDYNSGATGASLDSIYEKSDCTTLGSPISKWTVKPKYQRIVYYTSAVSSYEPSKGFINADSAIPHYGVHLGLREFNLLSGGRLNISAKFFIRAKNNK